MNTKSSRGAIPVIVYFASVLIIAGGIFAYRLFAPGRNKKQADQIALVATQAQVQAQAAKEKAAAVKVAVDQANTDHAQVIATRDKIDQNASGFVAAGTIALQSDKQPTPAETVALGLLDSASQALGQPLTEAQRAFWMKTVGGLIAQNSADQVMIRQMTIEAAATRASLTAVQAHADASDTHAATLAGQLSEQTKTLAVTTSKAANLADQNKAWADNVMTLWGRIKALGGLVVVLVVIAGLIGIKLLGVQGTAKDAVALVEFVKGEAVKAGHDEALLQQKIAAWFGTESKAKAKLEALKATLRL